MVRRRLSLPFTDVKEDDEVVTDEEINQPTSIPEIPADVGAINSETYELSDLDLDIGDWNIPKVATSQFYKSSSWSPFTAFKTDYHVKTIEQVYGINKEYETCYLLSPSAIQKHRAKGHNFLHIGLVQIGVKTLGIRRLGSDTKRGVSYRHWESGDWALKPDKCGR